MCYANRVWRLFRWTNNTFLQPCLNHNRTTLPVLSHPDELNVNHLLPPPSPVQTLWEHFPKPLMVTIDWRRYVVSVAARAAPAALFGYLCLRRNEFQLEYQSRCALSYVHAQAELLANSLGLIWVYLFLKKGKRRRHPHSFTPGQFTF